MSNTLLFSYKSTLYQLFRTLSKSSSQAPQHLENEVAVIYDCSTIQGVIMHNFKLFLLFLLPNIKVQNNNFNVPFFQHSEEDKVIEEEETSNPLILHQILSKRQILSQRILASDSLHQCNQILLPVLLILMHLFSDLSYKHSGSGSGVLRIYKTAVKFQSNSPGCFGPYMYMQQL